MSASEHLLFSRDRMSRALALRGAEARSGEACPGAAPSEDERETARLNRQLEAYTGFIDEILQCGSRREAAGAGTEEYWHFWARRPPTRFGERVPLKRGNHDSFFRGVESQLGREARVRVRLMEDLFREHGELIAAAGDAVVLTVGQLLGSGVDTYPDVEVEMPE